MKALFYSTKAFEKEYLVQANKAACETVFLAEALSLQTAARAAGFDAVSIFAGDDASAPVIKALAALDLKFIALRSAGYDNVDIEEAAKHGITVCNVPAYSPYSVAEHTVALLLALNRKLTRADRQVKAQDFSLDNLIGFDLHGKTVGIVGTGRIGAVFARIMHGFGCRLLGYDVTESKELQYKLGLRYVSLDELCRQSDVVSLHTPLTPKTKHLIAAPLLQRLKPGAILLNTARGALVKTEDVITQLQNGRLGGYGMDVYEKERGLFFYNRGGENLNDPQLQTLLNLPNVVVTPHQAFATKEALTAIAETTFANMEAWANYGLSGNELTKAAKLL